MHVVGSLGAGVKQLEMKLLKKKCSELPCTCCNLWRDKALSVDAITALNLTVCCCMLRTKKHNNMEVRSLSQLCVEGGIESKFFSKMFRKNKKHLWWRTPPTRGTTCPGTWNVCKHPWYYLNLEVCVEKIEFCFVFLFSCFNDIL